MNLRAYYYLTKPGIVYGNALAAVGGYFLAAARGHFQAATFLGMLVGLSLIIASACVSNNYLDRGLDRTMARTRRRALVTGQISPRAAIVYACLLALGGAALLIRYTNALTLLLALAGWVLYVAVYGYAKRKTVYGTEVGSLSGAVPPVVGYVAVTGRLDAAAWLLFGILIIWQMPHFYAIAMYRVTDYAAASLPVLPVKKGGSLTRKFIFGYIVAFTILVGQFTWSGYTGVVFWAVMTAAGLAWLISGIRTRRLPDELWAKTMFKHSLLVLLLLCVMLSTGVLLP